jgi:S-(hydroxymethyl)glutathione dehydrogenase/alcohol dehydrogenase
MSLTTEAAVLIKVNEPLHLMELKIPELKPGQVLVDVAFSGVCQSQLNEVQGKRGPDPFLPHTLGHEGSGVVIALGEGVTKVKRGDRVVLTWLRGAGADVPSTSYGSEIGTVNSGAISTFMSQTVICENRLVPILDSMPFREAALLGCAIPTGGGIVLNTMQVKAGDSVAVFGVGGIGMSAIAIAVMQGAGMIIAIDVSEEKLERARRLGASHTVNAAIHDPLEAVKEATDGKGVDFAVEAAGRREVMETAFRSVRDGGGLCVLAGNVPIGDRISIDPFDLIRGKRIVGSWGGETDPDRDVALYASLFDEGKLNLDPLITHTYSLNGVNDALAELAEGAVGRAVIEMS